MQIDIVVFRSEGSNILLEGLFDLKVLPRKGETIWLENVSPSKWCDEYTCTSAKVYKIIHDISGKENITIYATADHIEKLRINS